MKNYSKLMALASIVLGFNFNLSAQCTSCTTTISGADASNHTVLSGQTLCISSTGSVSGLITVSPGGILCNQGVVNSPNLWVAGGLFNNYGTINTNQLMVSQSGDFFNYGPATIDSLLVTESGTTFVNNGTVTNIRFTTAASATTTNNGSITSDFLFDSAGVFNNNGNVTVNFDFGNAYSGTYNNNANAYTKINRDFYNSYSAVFNVGNCLITVGRDWYNSAQISAPTTGGVCGGFNITGVSLNSGIVGNTAMHIDLCDAGHPSFGIDGNSGTIASTTTYCSCTNACVVVGIAEQIKESNVLIKNIYPNPASSNITLVLNTPNGQDLVVEIKNMMGQIVYTKEYSSLIGENSILLPVSSLAEGTYVLSVSDEANLQTKKMFNVIK